MDHDGDVGVVDVDLLFRERFAESRADELVHLEGMALIGGGAPASVHLEAPEVAGLPHRSDGGGDELPLVKAAFVRKRDAGHAGHAPDGCRHGLRGLTVLGLDDHVTRDTLDVAHLEVAQGPMEIGHELVLEG